MSSVVPVAAIATDMSHKPKRTPKVSHGRSVDHLVNFSLPRRQTAPPVQSLPRRHRKTGNQQGFWNKDKYIHAQYRFILKPTGDYTVHFADPDIYFQWEDILQVIVPRISALAAAAGRIDAKDAGHVMCPICLSCPTAPRMTKCGHIFCFPCVLHYLKTSDHATWHRCPICFDSITEKQLKSVHWFDEPLDAPGSSSWTRDAPPPDPGLDVTRIPEGGSVLEMRLMQRPANSTLALPRSATWPSDALSPHQAPFHFLPDVTRFAKFMLATPDYLQAELTRDLDELAAEISFLSRMGDDDMSLLFLESAVSKVGLQIEKAGAMNSEMLEEAISKADSDVKEALHRAQLHEERLAAASASTQIYEPYLGLGSADILAQLDYAAEAPSTRSSTPKPTKPKRNVNPPPPPTSTYYYYQASSGAPIFLYPLEIRILLKQFREYATFPSSIKVRVEAADIATVDDALRRRCKYLGNMPEATDVVFVEADLEGVVGVEAVKPFERELETRRAKRKEKGKKDDRARQKAEEVENEKMWAGVVANAHLSTPIRYSARDFDDDDDEHTNQDHATPPSQQSEPLKAEGGAWGQRSFASTLHAPPGARSARSARDVQADRDAQEEWDRLINEASATVKKKKGRKMVVLGGGGGGGRRR